MVEPCEFMLVEHSQTPPPFLSKEKKEKEEEKRADGAGL